MPWIRQWHDEAGGRSGLGDYFATFVDEEARELGTTAEAARAWQAPKKRRRRRKKASSR